MSKSTSRGTDIDVERCVSAVGGNKFNLILIATYRARELRQREKDSDTYKSACVSAMLEIQDGRVDAKRYLMKVK